MVCADLTVFRTEEIFITETTAAAAAAVFAFTVLFHQHTDRQAHQRTDIRRQCAVSGSYQHFFIDTGQAGIHFLHSRIFRTGHTVKAVQQRDFFLTRHCAQRIECSIECRVIDTVQALHLTVTLLTDNTAGGGCTLL